MKKLFKNSLNKGLSTLEILLAFAILILAITAVLQLGFGNQSISVDAETNTEALYRAQSILENAKASTTKDFFSIVSKTFPTDSIYSKDLIIDDLTPCKKQATSTISWNVTPLRGQTIELTTFFTDVAGTLALGGDCSTEPPLPSDWRKPQSLSYTGVSLKTDGFGRGIDSVDGVTYLVTTAAGNNKDDFFIFDTSDPENPIKRGFLDVSSGLESVDIADNFAYLANDENASSKQLIIVDVNDVSAPEIVASTTLPGVTGNCPNTCPGGRSIYYYKDRVYLGTHRLVAGGASEFHVYDVSDPTTPNHLGKKGGTALGDVVDHNINDIFVREQTVSGVKRTYAFLATSNNSGELIILNVTDPANIPDPAGTANTGSILNLPGTNGAGENLDALSIYVLGNKAYIGRERATGTNEDFFVVDISNPHQPVILGSTILGLNSNGSGVVGIRAASRLVFVATTDPNKPFVVLDISSPASITRWDLPACAIDYSTYATGIDFDNNQIYLSLHNASSNINLIIIKANGGSC